MVRDHLHNFLDSVSFNSRITDNSTVIVCVRVTRDNSQTAVTTITADLLLNYSHSEWF